jgi:hypothetical protein
VVLAEPGTGDPLRLILVIAGRPFAGEIGLGDGKARRAEAEGGQAHESNDACARPHDYPDPWKDLERRFARHRARYSPAVACSVAAEYIVCRRCRRAGVVAYNPAEKG